MKRNELCWCGSGKKYKKCHLDFDERIVQRKSQALASDFAQNAPFVATLLQLYSQK